MAVSKNYTNSDRLKYELECSLGCELQYSEHLPNQMLWEITATNGNKIRIGYDTARILLQNCKNSYSRYVFPTQMQAYTKYDPYTTLNYSINEQYYNQRYIQQSQCYPAPSDMQTLVNVSVKKDTLNKSRNLKKLYWNMYQKLGRDPLKEISCS